MTLTAIPARASDLRHMLYTLTRFLQLKPDLPCRLGGILRYEGERTFLTDAQHRFELEGPAHACATGDWVSVEALRVHGTRVVHAAVECVHRPSLSAERDFSESRRFAAFVREVRDFFVARDFSEIHTPTLVRCPGMEPNLEAFAVEVRKARETCTAYLPTSPEIHLKKALALGFTDIFEIKPCFRKGEFSAHHENEFFMLEWYRAFADLKLIAADLQALLDHLARANKQKPYIRETTWRELFEQELDFALTPETRAEELRELCRKHGIHEIAGDTFNDLFHRLVIDKIELKLKARGPLLVRDFPPSQAALAKKTAAGWADRFEFYWNGLEIANAFNEVNDWREQSVRWQAESEERRHLKTSELAQDEELISLMRERGFPPTGGIALGIERLFMAFYGVNQIAQLRLFSTAGLFFSI